MGQRTQNIFFSADTLFADTVYIRPQSELLSRAKGTVPHPKVLVTVEWKVVGNQLFLKYSVPEGVLVIVKPRGRLAGFVLNINKNNTL